MKKKIVAVLLAAVTTISMTACGSSAATTASSAAPAASAAASTAAASTSAAASTAASTTAAPASAKGEDANTLTVWCWDENFNVYAMKEAAKIYQKDNPDFKLNVVTTAWDDVQTAITTAATSGDYSSLPDIILCQDNAFQKNAISYPDLFQDLTSSGIDFSQFAAGKTAYSTVDGKNMGVPFDNGAVIACYRTDILEQAGYKASDLTDITWDQFEKIGEDVLAKTGYALDSTEAGEPDLIMMMMQSAGASLFDDQGKPDIADNATLKAVIKAYTTMAKSGVLAVTDDSWDEYVKSFNSGKTAGAINGCWIMASIESAKDQSGKWAITDMPKLSGVDGATNYSNNGGSSWAVTANCTNTKLAYDFLGKTFAGSTDLYANILPSSGAIATYAPAAKSDVYGQPSEFFGGDTVFTKIVDFASKVPTNNTGVYYYEARDAVGTAITNIMNGADVDSELKNAQSTVEGYMQ
jgi:lactose/L-arabinose transport system substrate-binding protein